MQNLVIYLIQLVSVLCMPTVASRDNNFGLLTRANIPQEYSHLIILAENEDLEHFNVSNPNHVLPVPKSYQEQFASFVSAEEEPHLVFLSNGTHISSFMGDNQSVDVNYIGFIYGDFVARFSHNRRFKASIWGLQVGGGSASGNCVFRIGLDFVVENKWGAVAHINGGAVFGGGVDIGFVGHGGELIANCWVGGWGGGVQIATYGHGSFYRE
jgi:hypothetical protein